MKHVTQEELLAARALPDLEVEVRALSYRLAAALAQIESSQPGTLHQRKENIAGPLQKAKEQLSNIEHTIHKARLGFCTYLETVSRKREAAEKAEPNAAVKDVLAYKNK